MKTTDMVVVRELMRSVYVTGEQREALGRLLAEVDVLAVGFEAVHVAGGGPKNEAGRRETAIEEDERHALLGPCGAE